MLPALLMGISFLGVVKAENAVDDRLQAMKPDCLVHRGEHVPRADVDALHTDGLAIDHARIDRACAAERANDVDRAAGPYCIHRLLKRIGAADFDDVIEARST